MREGDEEKGGKHAKTSTMPSTFLAFPISVCLSLPISYPSRCAAALRRVPIGAASSCQIGEDGWRGAERGVEAALAAEMMVVDVKAARRCRRLSCKAPDGRR